MSPTSWFVRSLKIWDDDNHYESIIFIELINICANKSAVSSCDTRRTGIKLSFYYRQRVDVHLLLKTTIIIINSFISCWCYIVFNIVSMFMWTLLLWTHHNQKIETRGDKDCCRPVRLHEDIYIYAETNTPHWAHTATARLSTTARRCGSLTTEAYVTGVLFYSPQINEWYIIHLNICMYMYVHFHMREKNQRLEIKSNFSIET